MNNILDVIDDFGQQIDNMIGINDKQARIIMHLIRSTWKIDDFSLRIDIKSKIIEIVPRHNGNPIVVRPKNPEILDNILTFSRVKDYKLRFWVRE